MARTNKPIFAVGLIALGLILAAFGVAAVSPQGSTVTAATNAVGVESVSADIPMSLQASIDAASSGCTNAPGPQVTLSGELALGGLETKMIFQNNVQGTHTHEDTSTATAVVIPAGESISIPKQPAYGGTGGNPWIWLQFTDVNGNGMTDPLFLGRCVQGLSSVDAPLTIAALATATVTGGTCSNTGSTISLSGELKLSGLNAMLMFANNDNPVGGPHQANVMSAVSVVLIPAGQSITFAKQPSLGGVGGNPWIYLQFLDGKGGALTDPVLLGRCVQDF